MGSLRIHRHYHFCRIDHLERRALLSDTIQTVPIGGGGYVPGLACSFDGDAIYARTDVGGAYRWDGNSAQWRPITDSLPNDGNNNAPLQGIASLAVDPSNANRLYILAGGYTWSSPSGIYVSANTNATTPTWSAVDSTISTQANGTGKDFGERLAVDPNNPSVLYCGTNNITGHGVGLMKYYYDTSWHGVSLPTPAVGDANLGISFVAVDKNGGTVSDGIRTISKYIYIGVYSSTSGAGGVYVSNDGGTSWTKITGMTVDRPRRGEVGPDGTLYVAFDGTVARNGGVAKVARGTSTFTSIAPITSLCYNALAVDPSTPGTVMVAEVGTASNVRMWRSTNGGSTWVVVNRKAHACDLDGTPSVTSSGGVMSMGDLLINPANSREVWVSDFFGVQRTQNIKDDTTASDWYVLQKNMEEVCPLDLKSASSGAPLVSAVNDVNGYVHTDTSVRPTPADQFSNPSFFTTTGIDFCESTSGSSTVWARVGDILWYTNTDADRNGAISMDDGHTWAAFGQLDYKTISNSTTAGWETFDVGPYLRQQQAAGLTTVTLVVRISSWSSSSSSLQFSSREGGNAPQVVINGSTSLSTIADATVALGSATTNYGNSPTLVARSYYDQAWSANWIYLKFDLSSVSSISSATLRLYRLATTDTAKLQAGIYATPTTNWVEGNGGTDNSPAGEITANNRPTLYTPPANLVGGRIAISATDSGKLVWVGENGTVWYSGDRGVSWARAAYNGSALTVDTMTKYDGTMSALSSDRVAANTFYLYSTTSGGTIYRSIDGGATWSVLVSSVGTAHSYKLEAVPGMSGRFWFVSQNWNSSAQVKYWTGSSLLWSSGLSSIVDFSFGAPAAGRTNPVIYVRRSDYTYWYSVTATTGSGFTWTQVNVPPVTLSATLIEGDRQVPGRFYIGTNGRGLFRLDVAALKDVTAPTLSLVSIAQGAVQRSMVNTIDVIFSEDVILGTDALSVLTSTGAAVSGLVTTITPLDARSYHLTFSGSAVIGGSLPDGMYQLYVKASAVHDRSGNALAADQTSSFHRFFGDADGNGVVNNADSLILKGAYATTAASPAYLWYFDFDNSGSINNFDNLKFKANYGKGVLA